MYCGQGVWLEQGVCSGEFRPLAFDCVSPINLGVRVLACKGCNHYKIHPDDYVKGQKQLLSALQHWSYMLARAASWWYYVIGGLFKLSNACCLCIKPILNIFYTQKFGINHWTHNHLSMMLGRRVQRITYIQFPINSARIFYAARIIY